MTCYKNVPITTYIETMLGTSKVENELHIASVLGNTHTSK